jgi:hypothetical protein
VVGGGGLNWNGVGSVGCVECVLRDGVDKK